MSDQMVARIVSVSDKGLELCAAAARISTTEGSAMDLFEARQGGERDVNLVKKVLASGHKSLIEHHVFSLALDRVSVLVEQFLIECRLCSFTVKSRRYVDFERAGFYVPDGLDERTHARYVAAMTARFADYAALCEAGVPREDARFVLPYCFYSNLYMTVNARELVKIITAMRVGYASAFPELRAVGDQLAAQFDALYPGVLGDEAARAPGAVPMPLCDEVGEPRACEPTVRLVGAPADAPALLAETIAFTGRFAQDALRALTRDARARELEALNYTFRLSGVSLATVTHFARHRIQSPLFAPTLSALHGGGYVLPQSVKTLGGDVQKRYESAFHEQAKAARALGEGGLSPENLSYLALAGFTVDLMTTMNARELIHFLKLRTCERAQWEIRGLSETMLDLLRQSYPALFRYYGPSCAVDGRCPEGRLSCGRPRIIV